MDNKDQEQVSFQVHEADMARMERNNHRMLIALIAVIIALLLNNLAWMVYENHRQSEQVTYETEKINE